MTATQNPRDRQSRLSMSLSHVLGEKKPAEKTDPFIEAEINPDTSDPQLQINAPSSMDETEDAHESKSGEDKRGTMDKEKAPTPLRFDMEKKEKRVGGKRASLALLLSLLAVSGTSYVCYNQYLQSADLAQGNEDAFKLIGSLSDDLNTNTLDLATLKSKTVIFEEALQGFTLLEKELADQRKKIANLDSVTRSQNQEIAEALASLQQSQDHLEALKSNFQGLSQSQKEIVKIAERKIAQARVAPAPEHTEPSRPIISSTLGTAAIESMDSWGNTQYVVIRDSSGEWISVRKGNTYDGWLFTGATNEYAVFTRGDRTMKVKIGG